MPGLDDTLSALVGFRRALGDFDERLRTGVKDLALLEERLNGLWDDDFRREFEKRRAADGAKVAKYLNRDGEHYLRFLDGRIRHLRRFLGHA